MPKIDPAFQLRRDRVWIDNLTAIDGAHDALDADRSVLGDLHLGHLREIGAEDALHRNAAALARRHLLPPAGLFRGQFEHPFGARRFFKQYAAVFDRILTWPAAASSSMKLSTTKMLWVGPTPRQNRFGHARWRLCGHNRRGCWEDRRRTLRAFDCVAVEAVLENWRSPARHNRGGRDPVCPGHRACRCRPGPPRAGRNNKAGTNRAGCLPRAST